MRPAGPAGLELKTRDSRGAVDQLATEPFWNPVHLSSSHSNDRLLNLVSA